MYPMSTKSFKARAEELFLDRNPGATITGWLEEPDIITWPTGFQSQRGLFRAEQEGYRTMAVEADLGPDDGIFGIRPLYPVK